MGKKNILHQTARAILSLCGKLPVTVRIQKKEGVLVRYSHQGIHQNTFQDTLNYAIDCPAKDGVFTEEGSDLLTTGIRKAVERLFELCGQPHNSPLPHFRKYKIVRDFFPLDLKKVPQMAERTVGETIERLRAAGAGANGYYSAFERHFLVANSAGLLAHHPMTSVRFAVTVTKGVGKGYSTFFSPDPKKLAAEKIFRQALEHAEAASEEEVRLEAGNYECIFSPRALLELISLLLKHFDAKLYHDGRSTFAEKLGKPVASKAVSLEDNVYLAGQSGIPFDAEGIPRRSVALIRAGRLTGLLAGRGLKCQCHKTPTGHTARGILEEDVFPQNLVMPAGPKPWKDMLSEMKRGVFIDKIWYHQVVHEKDLVVTGTATAGSCFVQNGKIVGRTVRLRYHDSLLRVLEEAVEMSRERTLLKDGEYGAALLPYLKTKRLRLEPA